MCLVLGLRAPAYLSHVPLILSSHAGRMPPRKLLFFFLPLLPEIPPPPPILPFHPVCLLAAGGKFVDRAMVAPLFRTCRTAARGLEEVMALDPGAEDGMRALGVRGKVNAAFMQVGGGGGRGTPGMQGDRVAPAFVPELIPSIPQPSPM